MAPLMPPSSRVAFEVCVDSAIGLQASHGLSDRIELCTALDIGGLTPSAGLLQCAQNSGQDVHVLIRPSGGDFTYDTAELDVILRDIATVRDMGLAGVVIGAVADAALDIAALEKMMCVAGDLCVTLHRAIDVVDDPLQAIDCAIDLGMRRVLTSGGTASAFDGRATIAKMVDHAQGRIEVMAGAGVNSGNVDTIIGATQVPAVHASCRVAGSGNGPDNAFGFGAAARQTSRAEVQAIRAVLDAKAC